MAADIGELLVPYMPTIRVPRSGDRVYKNECAFSFDSPESEGGLYVCMSTFLGFGREHVERHYRKTGQCVYMHLKRTIREKATGASGGVLPKKRSPRIFLDLEVNKDFNNEDYEYEDEAKLVIFPDHFEIPLPNIEELPALVTIACDAVLSAKSPYGKQDSESWEEELKHSKHEDTLQQLDNGVRIPPSGWKCAWCDLRENLWLNLTDGSILCGKWFFDGSGGNGHALEHYRKKKYPLAVKLGTITPDGADVYSFDEEEAVLDANIAEHLMHFGIDMLTMQTSENGNPVNDIKPRISEWEVVQESGTKLKPIYGSGYTGIKNLGNSCYLSSVMQIIFSIPDFQRRYVGNLQRIFDYSPLDPTQDFETQMAKLGHALLSGQYSKPPMKSEVIEQVMKEEKKPQQQGMAPRMFKALVGKGHPEFSSNRQQDALEFFLHLISLVDRNNNGTDDPSEVFRFMVEDRVQCCQSRKVKYTQRVDYIMQLPAVLETASNKEELVAYELKRREAEIAKRPLREVVRAKIPFSACLQAFQEPENVSDFWSSALQAKSAAVKTIHFASFPEYLVIQIKKFTFGIDWVPKKLDVSIDMPDLLDISHLRATGLQPGEEELPDIFPPIVITDQSKGHLLNHFMESPEIDESAVMQLAEMGFPLEACRKAVYYTGNLGAELAFNWIIAHMEEPDFAEPLTLSGCNEFGSGQYEVGLSGGASSVKNQPPEEIVAIITSMGFHRNQAIQALKATNNNLERALDWIFTHADSEDESEAVSEVDSQSHINTETEPAGPRIKDGPGRGNSATSKYYGSWKPDKHCNCSTGQAIFVRGSTVNIWVVASSVANVDFMKGCPGIPAIGSVKGYLLPSLDGFLSLNICSGYELFAFISHMGASTMSGHYVCHIKKEGRWVIYNDHKVYASEKPPKDLGYIYFYQRIAY